jgi:hypothetical protein
VRRRSTARPGLVSVLAVSVLCATATADAAGLASASRTQTPSTIRWAVVATLAASAPVPGPLTLTFNRSTNVAPPQYFNVINTGTTPLAGAIYGLSQSDTTTVTIEACSTTWNETTHTCSGLTTTLVTTAVGSTTGSASSTVVPTNPGAVLRLRARPAMGSRNAQDTYTISTSVNRAAVRAGTTTSS